jgi:hypothetical protein
MNGVYQNCGEQHRRRYLAEFDFRFNERAALGVNDSERATKMLQGIVGNERYTALYAAIQTRATRWWLDPTSFIAFESDSSIDQLCTALKGALAASHDMFLLREIDRKEARLFGKQKDPDIKILMPYLMAA